MMNPRCDIHEKGKAVNRTKRTTVSSSGRSSLVAVALGLFLGADGRGGSVFQHMRVRDRRVSGVLRVAGVTWSLLVFAAVVMLAPAAEAKPSASAPQISNVTTSSAHLSEPIEAEGLETEYDMEYTSEPQNAGSWSVVPGGGGTVSVGRASGGRYQGIMADLTGLAANTTYFVRLFVKNSSGETTSVAGSFSTAGPPAANTFPVHAFAVGSETLRMIGSVTPNGSSVDEEQMVTIGGGATGGTFKLCYKGQCTGASGAGTTEAGSKMVTGLSTSGGVFAQDEQISGSGIPAGTLITGIDLSRGRLELSAPATESSTGVALSADLAFIPHETEPGEFSEKERINQALKALPGIGQGNVGVDENFASDTYTVQFRGALAGQDLPQLTADGSGLTPSGTVTVATVLNGAPFSYGYHFEYTTTDFANCGLPANPGCSTTPEVELPTPEVDLGTGRSSRVATTVGADLAGASPGQTYRYRIVGSNSTPGDPRVDGIERSLAVPVPAEVAAQGSCPNEEFRTGPSAHLPDCRAYEQVTPLEKEGSMDIFVYGNIHTQTLVGEDGDHVAIDAQFSKWGASVDPSNDSYFFAREAGRGWRMTSSTPAGADQNSYTPLVFSPDLAQTGLMVGWGTSLQIVSPNLEFVAGPPGGPYTTAAVVPRSKATKWVAASADFSKLILASEDRALVPGQTSTTTSGMDLYEYSEGQLRQLNVGPGGASISSCGASMASAPGGLGSRVSGVPGASVSSDGSRVLFTDNCTHHLYMRENGVETVDLGEYSLFAANASDSKLLLVKGPGSAGEEVILYVTETKTVTPLPGAHAGDGKASEDLSTIYFTSSEQLTPDANPAPFSSNLYRYDVASKSLSFTGVQGGSPESVSPDGRYVTFIAKDVPGVDEVLSAHPAPQPYRYDSASGLIQCISCSSPFAPRPQGPPSNGLGPVPHLGGYEPGYEFMSTPNSVPEQVYTSANGDYLFFTTTVPLLPADVDGEIPQCVIANAKVKCNDGGEAGNTDEQYSASSDVYEWRRDGLDGCAHVQGCLALITSGSGGLRNSLLGTDASGRDVFFATHSQLAATDTDGQGDVYDARIGGGFVPVSSGPVECEGDACSTPASPPIDATPSSLTFTGAGNVPQSSSTKPVVKPKKPRHRKLVRGRKLKKRASKTSSSRGRDRAATRSLGGSR